MLSSDDQLDQRATELVVILNEILASLPFDDPCYQPLPVSISYQRLREDVLKNLRQRVDSPKPSM